MILSPHWLFRAGYVLTLMIASFKQPFLIFPPMGVWVLQHGRIYVVLSPAFGP